jgi:hypothetical protein
VLGGALLLLWIAWLLFWPDGGGSDESGTPAAATSPSVTPTPTPTETETKSAKPKPSETTKSPAALEPACDDNAIAVTVTTDSDTYPPGRDPSFTLGVKNVSKKTCSRDVGQAALELQVTSGGDQVWSSDDCSPGGSNDRTNLAPGHQYVQSVAWSRQESSAGCPASPKAAPAGDYQVLARNLDKFSEPASFTLS